MDSTTSFREKLDAEHKWPCDYMFKFAVPAAKVAEFMALFPGEQLQSRPSKAGNYTSFTYRKRMNSADEVITIYQATGAVEGLIAL